MPSGSPKYTKELGELICDLIAEGKSLRSICALDGYPSMSTVFNWLNWADNGNETYKGFLEQYTRAKEIQADVLAEDILHIADDESDDVIHLKDEDDNKPVANMARLHRDKLRIESRKWLMGKMKPKKYGDKITQEHTGADGAPLTLRWADDGDNNSVCTATTTKTDT